jgi:DNA-binding LacI/PurR family transcriptional regulator
MKTKLTLQDIALQTGVSLSTVSRVFRGAVGVSPEMCARVRKGAADLGLDLNESRASKRVRTLAFVLSNRDMLHAFHSRILVGAEGHSAARGWEMLYIGFRYGANVPWKELHLPPVLQRRDVVRSLILAGTNSQNLLDLLTERRINFVVLGNNVLNRSTGAAYDAVFSDDIQGTFDMARYLHSLGHRSIWFVGNTRFPWAARCYEGYSRAMDELRLRPRLSSFDSEDDTEVGYLATKSCLSRGEQVTAILAATDVTAQGIYKALRERGIRVPEDVSVVGCNDTVGALLHPPLTTIREFPEQLGKLMVEFALNRIADPDLQPQQVSIPTELVKRESCGPFLATPGVSETRHSQASQSA